MNLKNLVALAWLGCRKIKCYDKKTSGLL